MKRCPSCQQTYPDDAPDYCSKDGMRLVDEDAASFDPEKTVMASGLRGGDFASPPSPPQPPPQPPPPPPQQQYQAPDATPDIKPPTQWQPASEQQSPQPWNAPGAQASPPGGWPAQQPPAQNWGGAPYQQPAANAPYGAPYAPAALHGGGRSKALSIAALVTGACAVTIMSLLVFRDRDFVFTAMLILAILGIGLGVTSLILSLQKPLRFGGVPLAIAGLATGTAALVYYFTL
jgi:hypothetical protein